MEFWRNYHLQKFTFQEAPAIVEVPIDRHIKVYPKHVILLPDVVIIEILPQEKREEIRKKIGTYRDELLAAAITRLNKFNNLAD